MVQVRIEELDGEVLPAIGEVGEALWEAVSGGQPVALTHRGRAAAVLGAPETYAEMVGAPRVPEDVSCPPAPSPFRWPPPPRPKRPPAAVTGFPSGQTSPGGVTRGAGCAPSSRRGRH